MSEHGVTGGDGLDGGDGRAGGWQEADGDTVTQDMFALLHQAAAPVVTRWTYHAADPFAVTMAIQTRSERWVEWLLGRDLLVAGLRGPVGLGDVRLRPERTAEWDIVLIEITSPDGHAVLEVDRDLLERFVIATLEAVPIGAELRAVDLDAEIARAIPSCFGWPDCSGNSCEDAA